MDDTYSAEDAVWRAGRVVRRLSEVWLSLSISVCTDRMGCTFSPLGSGTNHSPIRDSRRTFPFFPVQVVLSIKSAVQATFDRCFSFLFGHVSAEQERKREKKKNFVCVWSSVPGNRLMGELIGSCHIRDSV